MALLEIQINPDMRVTKCFATSVSISYCPFSSRVRENMTMRDVLLK